MIIILVLSSRVSKRVFARVLVAFNPRFPVGQPVATQICRLRVLRSERFRGARWFANFHPRSPFTRRAKLRLESVYDCSRVLIVWFYFFFFFFFRFYAHFFVFFLIVAFDFVSPPKRCPRRCRRRLYQRTSSLRRRRHRVFKSNPISFHYILCICSHHCPNRTVHVNRR